MPIRCLSVHADYRCRNSGVCCSTPWDVPVELASRAAIDSALAAGTLSAGRPFVGEPDPPSGAVAVLGRGATGACVFLEPNHLCAVHRAVGEHALPAACRLFPRIALSDRRGTFLTLSHYCPTAARSLLRDDVPLGVVEDPLAFPAGDYEGLAAESAWAPSLRPGVLMGLDVYAAWEQRAVDLCAVPDLSPESVLATLARDAEALRAWRPGGRSVREMVSALPLRVDDPAAAPDPRRALLAYRDVSASVPPATRANCWPCKGCCGS